MNQQPVDTPSGSLGGVLRAIGALVVVLLALGGVLVVLEVVPLDEAGRAAGKFLLAALIIGMASAVVGLLMRRKS